MSNLVLSVPTPNGRGPRKAPRQKPGKSRQDQGTPWPFIRAVEARFGEFAWDLAASESNAKARMWLDEEGDSLKVHWASLVGNLWLNPPFGNIAPFAEKCAIESARGAKIRMLVPASVGTIWFREFVHRRAYVLFLSPRLTFLGEKDPFPKDLLLCVYERGLHGYDCWRWDENAATAKGAP